MKKLLLLWMMSCALISVVNANNVVISNVSLVNNGPNNIYVQFDLSWENSWRVNTGPANYDGVWVFFKYKTPGGAWTHLILALNTTNDLLPAGIDYFRPLTLSTGTVIHRSAANSGMGTVSATGIRLGVVPTVPYDIELRAYATEMVYIPATPQIFLGDGNGTAESFAAFHGTDNTYSQNGSPISVDVNGFDDAEVETPASFSVDYPDGLSSLAVNNPTFPTLSPVWCMKYELTQGAYRDFLNTLTLTQQTTRTTNAPTLSMGTPAMYLTAGFHYRSFIEIKTPSNGTDPAVYGCDASGNNVFDEATDGEFIACNHLMWPDLAAWLDWSGMAPMTEIQFERICRGYTSAGGITPIMGEYAWGNISLFSTQYTLGSTYAAGEIATNASTVLGNSNNATTVPGGVLTGPFRNGIFATPISNRVTSGAAFFGVMDMSGNLTEFCATVGNICGRSYNKLNSSRGNGSLDGNGNANVPHWPGNAALNTFESLPSGSVVFNTGIICKGGSFTHGPVVTSVSDRFDASTSTTPVRAQFRGGRGIIMVSMY
jgi:formylglycine-generating enzyme required for sulfatase activity